MMLHPVTFHVNYTQPGVFAVTASEISRSGGAIRLSVDGGKPVEHAFAASGTGRVPAGQETVEIAVPAGAHTVTLDNPAADWVFVRQIRLSNYAPALAALGRIGRDYAAAWVYNRTNLDKSRKDETGLQSASGTVTVAGLQPGKYRASWWDCQTGKALDSADITVDSKKSGAVLQTPAVVRDVAVYIARSGLPPASVARGRGRRNTASARAPRVGSPDALHPVNPQ
jgi:hypothetical protein